jgi:hypothetical protein
MSVGLLFVFIGDDAAVGPLAELCDDDDCNTFDRLMPGTIVVVTCGVAA